MERNYIIPDLPLPYDLETKAVLKKLNSANKKLAELKGIARTIPNEDILISTLTLQEAKDSSAIENIVTTQDDLYKAELNIKEHLINASAKEVLNYREALRIGFMHIRRKKVLSLNIIKDIQETLEHNRAGFRNVPGTTLKRNDGAIVYTPPQDNIEIERLMKNLEVFINDDSVCDYDPLIKMAVIHHQFESIHPFYDGNGRTGRIINVLYLVAAGLLELPILYLSRYITHNKTKYYGLIQAIRDNNGDNSKEWEEWILFILQGVEETAEETIRLVREISDMMVRFKEVLRPMFGRQYKHELLNNLFFHPYTKVEFIQEAMQVSRNTALKYLDKIVEAGMLEKVKIWRSNYYVNVELMKLFISVSDNKNSDNDVSKDSVNDI